MTNLSPRKASRRAHILFTKQYDATCVSEITSFSTQTWFRPWITRNSRFSVIFPAAASHCEAVQTACSSNVISSCSKVGEAVRSGSVTLQQHSNIFITVKSSPRQDNPCSPLHQSLPLFFFFCSTWMRLWVESTSTDERFSTFKTSEYPLEVLRGQILIRIQIWEASH